MHIQIKIGNWIKRWSFFNRATSCSGKINWKTPEKAQLAVERMERKSGDSFNSYLCKFCGGWHIGHLPEHLARKE